MNSEWKSHDQKIYNQLCIFDLKVEGCSGLSCTALFPSLERAAEALIIELLEPDLKGKNLLRYEAPLGRCFC